MEAKCVSLRTLRNGDTDTKQDNTGRHDSGEQRILLAAKNKVSAYSADKRPMRCDRTIVTSGCILIHIRA